MTLRKQLLIVIISLFALIYVGTFLIHIENLRLFLSSHSEQQAQNTASALGVSISQYSKTDIPSILSLVDAVYQTGFYQKIILYNVNETPLVARTHLTDTRLVPSWFSAMISLDLSPGKAPVMDGWKQFGTIVVYADPELAYNELWNNFIDTLWWFGGAMLLTLFIAMLALRIILKPLEAVKIQAEAISSKNFVQQEHLPHTPELRSVVVAMNTLSSKVHDIFEEQTSMIEKARTESYTDPLTQLGNRRYFNMRLENFTKAKEEYSTGALFLLEIKHLDRYKHAHGFQAVEIVLQKMTDIFKKIISENVAFTAYFISDTTFALLAPTIFIVQAEKIAVEINQKILELNETELQFNTGIAIYQGTQTGHELLGNADHALRMAQTRESGAWQIFGTDKDNILPIHGAIQWNHFLQEVIDSQNIVLYYQPIISFAMQNKTQHYEVLLRIPAPNQQLLSAGVFIPEAENLHKMQDLDKLVIHKILSNYSSFQGQPKFAINLAPSSIKDAAFIDWLEKTLREHHAIASKLIFEVPESTAIYDLHELQHAIHILKQTGCLFALDHFGRGLSSLSYLQTLALDYVKIDGSFIHNVQKEVHNQFYIRLMTDIAHNMDIQVIAENTETEEELNILKKLNVDAAQGYLIGKPAEQLI